MFQLKPIVPHTHTPYRDGKDILSLAKFRLLSIGKIRFSKISFWALFVGELFSICVALHSLYPYERILNTSVGAAGIHAADVWMLNSTNLFFGSTSTTVDRDREANFGLFAVAGSKQGEYRLMLNDSDRPHIVHRITSHRRTKCYLCIKLRNARCEHLDSNAFDVPQIVLFTFSIWQIVINSNYIIRLMCLVVWMVSCATQSQCENFVSPKTKITWIQSLVTSKWVFELYSNILCAYHENLKGV